MWCWGWNLYGQLNVDPFFFTRVFSPIQVRGTFSSVGGGLGGHHTCGLTTSGAAYCWGGNFEGQLGDGTMTGHSEPQPVLPPG
jgi:alpha-tubulin suppressor-like RCC1 family protein